MRIELDESSRWLEDALLELAERAPACRAPCALLRESQSIEHAVVRQTASPLRAAVTAKLPPLTPLIRTSRICEPGLVEDPLDGRERVVLEVLVADRVVGVRAQHRRHVACSKCQTPSSARHARDVAGEGDRVLEVVEHRDRRDDARRLALGDRVEALGREEVGDDAGCRPGR